VAVLVVLFRGMVAFVEVVVNTTSAFTVLAIVRLTVQYRATESGGKTKLKVWVQVDWKKKVTLVFVFFFFMLVFI
jgi:hypothetical protein